MSTSHLVWTFSKAALKLVKAGKAVISSGGIRLLNGTMYEMAKPIVSNTLSHGFGGISLGPVGAVLNIASSLASNVQCGFIQKGIDAANFKLDEVITHLGRLETAMQGLNGIRALSWINSAFSLANSGISVAGFYMTLTKLKGIEEQLQAFFNRYKQDRNGDTVEQFRNFMLDMRNDLHYLQQKIVNNTFDKDSFIHREPFIEEHLNHTAAFIKRILTEFSENRIDGRIGCQIAFMLSVVYSQVVNEYCCQYYYLHHVSHTLFQDWSGVLGEINSPIFIEHLKGYLAFSPEYATLSPIRKNDAISISMESISECQSRLATCAEAIQHIPESDYSRLDDLLNQGIYISMAHANPELSDDKMMERVKNIEPDEWDYLVPVAVM